MAQAASPQAIAEYRRKLAEYRDARGAFEAEADAYWNSIAEKRRGRNAKRREHVRSARRLCADATAGLCRAAAAGDPEPSAPEPQEPRRERKYVPVVADLLKAAAEHFQFAPQQPAATPSSSAPMPGSLQRRG